MIDAPGNVGMAAAAANSSPARSVARVAPAKTAARVAPAHESLRSRQTQFTLVLLLGAWLAAEWVYAAPLPRFSPDEVDVPQVAARADWPKIWETYTALENRRRLRTALQGGLQLAARYERRPEGLPPAEIDKLLHEAEYAVDITARRSAQARLEAAIATIQQALLSCLPPLAAFDRPDDDGKKLIVIWPPVAGVNGYRLERRMIVAPGASESAWLLLGARGLPVADSVYYEDSSELRTDREYEYRLTALLGAAAEHREELIGQTGPTRPRLDLLNTRKLAFYGFMATICGAVVTYIGLAQRGAKLRIRKIAGLEALDEAVGRATEMGRRVLFVCGSQDVDNIQTVAGLTVLGRVARVVAEHDAAIEVPTNRALVMTAARETVSAAYMNAGRPDGFDEKQIYYVTEEQFGFAAGVTGIILRKQPAACVYMGAFFADSLILAETGNAIGSIQIAGTAEPAQLPFFVAACDYTLMGEEFFAASAYLSGEPRQLGSLKGQDIGKAILMLFLAVGVTLATIESLGEQKYGWAGEALGYLREVVLRTSD